MAYAGSCACGRISFKVSGDLLEVNWCYCVPCRKQAGGPFLPFGDFNKQNVSWSQQPDVWASSKFAERYYCKQCGSAIGMLYLFQPDRLGIVAGLFDGKEAAKLTPTAHIFLKDKPEWFNVPDDGAGRYQGFPGGFEKQIEEYQKAQQGD